MKRERLLKSRLQYKESEVDLYEGKNEVSEDRRTDVHISPNHDKIPQRKCEEPRISATHYSSWNCLNSHRCPNFRVNNIN